jgi:hypothetical protein
MEKTNFSMATSAEVIQPRKVVKAPRAAITQGCQAVTLAQTRTTLASMLPHSAVPTHNSTAVSISTGRSTGIIQQAPFWNPLTQQMAFAPCNLQPQDPMWNMQCFYDSNKNSSPAAVTILPAQVAPAQIAPKVKASALSGEVSRLAKIARNSNSCSTYGLCSNASEVSSANTTASSSNSKTSTIEVPEPFATEGDVQEGQAELKTVGGDDNQNDRCSNQADIGEHSQSENCPDTSKFNGVSWCEQEKRWAAAVTINTRSIDLGLFHSEIGAARQYDVHAVHLGQALNFPREAAEAASHPWEDRFADRIEAANDYIHISAGAK